MTDGGGEEGTSGEDAGGGVAEEMLTPERMRLSYAPPLRKGRTWFYVGAILLIPFSCVAIMAAYFVLNRLTGFSITD